MSKEHEGAAGALAGGHRRKGKPSKELHVRHAENGGYITKRHHMNEDGSPAPGHGKESIHPDMEALQAHMAQEMGPQQQGAPQEGAEPEEQSA